MPVLYLLLLFAAGLYHTTTQPVSNSNVLPDYNAYASIAAIPVPQGFTRTSAAAGSFAAWLRQLPLKKNKTVYLYNGLPKTNQSAQFAVINISTGVKNLQQCADAVMRLRAEYLYAQKRQTEIDFTDNNHTHYRLQAGAGPATFMQYLEKVFSYCGTASLDKQLESVRNFYELQPGDVLIKGGSPGHAMQVMDAAINTEGKKIYLLAQSYMPAQDMHVVVNPANKGLSPWYEVNENALIETPEWVFRQVDVKKWPAH